MAQQEHDARNADEQKPLNPIPVDDPAAAPENQAEENTGGQSPQVPVAKESVEEEVTHLDLANDDGTDENETDVLVPEIGPSGDDMEATPTLNDMEDETHLAISGTVDEDPELLGKAYEMAEAIADHDSGEQGTPDSQEEEAVPEGTTEATAGHTGDTQDAVSSAPEEETQEPEKSPESVEARGGC